MAVVDKGGKFVGSKDIGGNEGDRDHHVFIASHRSIQVEVLDVHGHEASTWGGEDTVEEKFGCGEARGFCTDITRIVNAVPTHCPANTTGLGFHGTISNDIAKVSGFATRGNLVVANEVDSVGADSLFEALGETANFFGAGFLP